MTKMPDFIAWSVVEDPNDGAKSRWKECGVCFTNKGSITVLLDTLPLSGKLVLLPPKEKEKEPEKMRIFPDQ
jgi:hypothetical protein